MRHIYIVRCVLYVHRPVVKFVLTILKTIKIVKIVKTLKMKDSTNLFLLVLRLDKSLSPRAHLL
jgi:hypothetical protein